MRHHDALAKIRHAADTGQKRLDLTSMGLESLPEDIAGLDGLETLDLSGNRLSGLPDCLEKLGGLRRIFLTKNQFESWPAVLGRMGGLEMVSFKSNRLERLPESDCLPAGVRWLILTDNRLEALPAGFGDALPRLRKLALAANRIEALPASFARLRELELLRLGMNRLEHRPPELEALPRLTWLGLGGNPYADDLPALAAARAKLADCRLDPGDYVLGAVLGSGASGVVRRADRPGQPGRAWAVKCFKSMSSDGNPEDELDIAVSAAYGAIPPGILPFRGWFPAPELSMVMDFVDDADPLGLVPSLESITRDCYPTGRRFESGEVRKILAAMARAQEHLIACRVVHGDFYAHNILADRQGGAWLGDWGASFFMGPGEGWMEKLEVRAFGCLAEELLERCEAPDPALAALRDHCLEDEPARRPDFRELAAALGS